MVESGFAPTDSPSPGEQDEWTARVAVGQHVILLSQRVGTPSHRLLSKDAFLQLVERAVVKVRSNL